MVRGQRGKLQAELTTSWQAMALALSASPAFLAGYQQIAHACDAGSRLQCSRIGKPPMRTPTMVATLEEKWSKSCRAFRARAAKVLLAADPDQIR